MEEEKTLYVSGTMTLQKTDNITNNAHEIVQLLTTKMEDIINVAQINEISIYEVMFKYFENGILSLQDIFDIAVMFMCTIRYSNQHNT